VTRSVNVIRKRIATRPRLAPALFCLLSLLCVNGGCGSANRVDSFAWIDGSGYPYVKSSTLSVRWSFQMTPEFSGVYLPVENAAPVLDLDKERIFTGSSTGTLWALSKDAKKLYKYSVGSPIEASPAVDSQTDQLYVGTLGAELHALRASDGSVRWRVKVPGPIRQTPLLLKDAVYVGTENDTVTAFARSNGEVLWRYRREEPSGLTVGGHAGIAFIDNKLLTAFTDGLVVALDPGDGHVLWEHDTSLDVEDKGAEQPRLVDVDTTPVLIDGLVYVASFSGGLYALSPTSGNEMWRDADLTGITATAGADHFLVLSSAEKGVLCMDVETHQLLWQYEIKRGAAGQPTIADQRVFVGESAGGFLALSLQTGQEIARIEFGFGFSSTASVKQGHGFVISNGGTLLAFNY
jgi:outer membrane protein assembly factor BamB